MAAPSVEARIEPSNMPSRIVRSNSHAAVNPATIAVTSVPSTAIMAAGRTTGRISWKPAARPPSNRISDSATMPTTRAAS